MADQEPLKELVLTWVVGSAKCSCFESTEADVVEVLLTLGELLTIVETDVEVAAGALFGFG